MAELPAWTTTSWRRRRAKIRSFPIFTTLKSPPGATLVPAPIAALQALAEKYGATVETVPQRHPEVKGDIFDQLTAADRQSAHTERVRAIHTREFLIVLGTIGFVLWFLARFVRYGFTFGFKSTEPSPTPPANLTALITSQMSAALYWPRPREPQRRQNHSRARRNPEPEPRPHIRLRRILFLVCYS